MSALISVDSVELKLKPKVMQSPILGLLMEKNYNPETLFQGAYISQFCSADLNRVISIKRTDDTCTQVESMSLALLQISVAM